MLQGTGKADRVASLKWHIMICLRKGISNDAQNNETNMKTLNIGGCVHPWCKNSIYPFPQQIGIYPSITKWQCWNVETPKDLRWCLCSCILNDLLNFSMAFQFPPSVTGGFSVVGVSSSPPLFGPISFRHFVKVTVKHSQKQGVTRWWPRWWWSRGWQPQPPR